MKQFFLPYRNDYTIEFFIPFVKDDGDFVLHLQRYVLTPTVIEGGLLASWLPLYENVDCKSEY